MTEPQQPRRASHLMDPTRPRVAATREEVERLQRVQRIVMSVLVFTTIFHLSVGLVIGAFFIDERYIAARVGLCLMGGLTGVVGIAATRAIHRRAPVSPWLLAGLVPCVAGLVVVLV